VGWWVQLLSRGTLLLLLLNRSLLDGSPLLSRVLLQLRPGRVHVYGADCLAVAVAAAIVVVVVGPLERGRGHGAGPAAAQVPHRIAVVERLANLAGQQGPVTVSEPVVEDGVQQGVDGRVGGAQPLRDRQRGDRVALDGWRQWPELDQRERHVQRQPRYREQHHDVHDHGDHLHLGPLHHVGAVVHRLAGHLAPAHLLPDEHVAHGDHRQWQHVAQQQVGQHEVQVATLHGRPRLQADLQIRKHHNIIIYITLSLFLLSTEVGR